MHAVFTPENWIEFFDKSEAVVSFLESMYCVVNVVEFGDSRLTKQLIFRTTGDEETRVYLVLKVIMENIPYDSDNAYITHLQHLQDENGNHIYTWFVGGDGTKKWEA